MTHKYIITAFLLLFSGNTLLAKQKLISQRVDSLMKLMTLDEKIGQLNQYTSDWESSGPVTKDGEKQQQIIAGKIGSMLWVRGTEQTRSLQELALKSRLKIPLLFGLDVEHGYRTIMPIPLAESASWDLEAIKQSAHIAATETSACGVHWTFAPMVDISRDPRWGRVMEGAGEDTYLGSLIAAARVRGFQGEGLGNTDAVMACAKHFAAYGACEGGRDYNSMDVSLSKLNNVYLPPFKAAVDAGCATLMNAFNDISGIPASANSYILRDKLKGQWKFSGFVVSDWCSIGEMIQHGYVSDKKEAAKLAMNAGTDMDMESRSYVNNLAALVKERKISMKIVDDAVRRILTKKFELGLFDDPFKFCNKAREQQQWNNPAHLAFAQQIARESVVLLKNDKNTLPLRDLKGKKIALIGPLVKAKSDHNGSWSFDYNDDDVRIASLWESLQQRVHDKADLLYAKGCDIQDNTKDFSEAVQTAQQADMVIIYVGEHRGMSGEARSRSDIHLPGVQEELVKAVAATGKP